MILKKRAGPVPAPGGKGVGKTRQGGLSAGLEGLQERIGYRFRDPARLREALTHSSRAHEDRDRATAHNERLEFLGDAVLGLAAARYLEKLFPGAAEGELTRRRASMVREEGLAEAGRRLGLGEHLLLGRGEERSGGRRKASILAGAVEALAGAVFLDGGWRAAYRLASKVFPSPKEVTGAAGTAADPKTRLQELCQGTRRETPSYRVVSRSGPSHRPAFTVAVLVGEEVLARGEGAAKKSAEQDAARRALAVLLARKGE